MKANSNPSYLFKSHQDIYYFRVRIPSFIRNQYSTTKVEVKKSLQTRCYVTALKEARRLWVRMEDTDYGMLPYQMKNTERELQEDNEGRKLLKQLLLSDLKSKGDGYFRDNDIETDLDELVGGLSPREKGLLNIQLEQWNKLSEEERNSALEEIRIEIKPIQKEQVVQKSQRNTNDSPFSNALVSVKVDEFLDYHFERKRRSGKPVPEGTINEYQGIYREFLLIIGEDLKCCDLDKRIVKKYEKAIWDIPANHTRKPKYKEKEISELLRMEIPNEDKRSPLTYNKHIMRVRQFLKWAGQEDHIITGLEGFLESVPDNVKANEKKDAFTGEELTKLFNYEVYERGKFKNPARYWLPLVALFTGARGEEIAQLYCDDIQCDEETGVNFIEIRANEKRKQGLKNKSAPRKIPIHSQLIKLGFLEFVGDRNGMLFPELDNGNGKFFKSFGNNFNRKSSSGWKWKCGVKGNTSFHSFRHNVVNFLVKAGVPDRLVCSLVGHQHKGGGVVANYVKDEDLRSLQKSINQLKFPSISWKKIQKRRW